MPGWSKLFPLGKVFFNSLIRFFVGYHFSSCNLSFCFDQLFHEVNFINHTLILRYVD